MVLEIKALNLVNTALARIRADINPGVTPNSDAPFIATLQNLAGSIMMACIVIAVIALVVATVFFIMGKIGGNSRAQEVGFMAMVWVIAGAAIIGSASGLVAWGSGLQLS